MRSRFKNLSFLLIAVGLFVAGMALPAMAAQTDSAELVIITEDDVVTEDLYAVANRVIIRGVVDGDLIAIAGQDVRIEGEVTGSVMALSPEVVVTGKIGKSLRATSPSILVEGSIGNDLVALAGHLKISDDGSVAKDVVLWAWNAELLGTIGGGIEGSQRNLDLAGEVAGDVSVSVRRLTIVGPLTVGGDLDYRSGNDAEGLDQATVGGAVVRQEPLPANIRLRALGLVGRFLVAISLSALALLVVWGWPDRTQLALDNLKTSPIRSFFTGISVMASPLLLAAVGVLIFNLAPANTALPLVGALIPVFLALVGLVFVLALVAGIPAAAWMGSVIKKNVTIAGAVGLGAAVVSVIWLIPMVGWVVALLVLAFGLGAWIGSFRRRTLET
jgi:cytoskeletal protein CcmA (bactofilin family)